LVNESTGEIDSQEFKKNAYKISENGISMRFGLEKQITASQVVEEYLTILLPSKVLGSRYFEGITSQNVSKVYDYIQSKQVVSFSLDTFLNQSACTDVDFKKDTKYQNLDVLLPYLQQRTRLSNKKGEGCRMYLAKENQGIEWSDRRTTSFKSNPYLKIYNKALELKHQSKTFRETYLRDMDFSDVVRIETTIKNKKHFKALGVDDTSLRALLILPEERKNAFIFDASKKHLEERKRADFKQSDISPMDAILLSIITQAMESGRSYGIIKSLALDNLPDAQSRRRMNKKLDTIYRAYIEGTAEDKFTKKLEPFLNILGIG